MPVGAAVAGIGIIGGLAGKKSAKKIQKEANAIARETLDFNKERYYSYKKLYGGLESQLVADAENGVKADLAGVTNRAAADVTQQFANSEEERLRNAQRLGINPNSGRAEAGARKVGMGKATAEAFAITNGRETERRDADEKTWSRRATVTGLGINQMNGAASGVNSASGNLQQSYQNAANAKNAEANQLFGAAGSIVGMGLGGGLGKTGSTTSPSLSNGGFTRSLDAIDASTAVPPLSLSFN